ncbi:hypothetical protein HMPREF9148_00610 [Prevotella sp. F0091]|nr:hypothetical protein HMPREF9148_00610 [Prevotella sp. F0091]
MFTIRTMCAGRPHHMCAASRPRQKRESKPYYGDLLVFILLLMRFTLPL